jgi:transposase
MIRLEFTEKEIATLNYERFHHPHPRVQRKMEVLYLKSQGLAHQEICRLTRISGAASCTYLHDYQQGGIERLKTVKFYRPQSELGAHTQSLEAYFQKHPPQSVKEAGAKIEELTGIKRSPTQVRQFLSHLGLKRRKVGVLPAKANLQQQEDFKKSLRTTSF